MNVTGIQYSGILNKEIKPRELEDKLDDKKIKRET